MAPKAQAVPATLSLPPVVVGRADVGRLNREVERLDDELQQAGLRGAKAGDQTAFPELSRQLQDTLELNELDVSDDTTRQHLRDFLTTLKADAPTIHMSFAVVPSPEFTAKIIEWLRREINPSLLLDIGLQPTIAAGCVIRTTNKYFDCSVRQHLVANRPKLLELIRGKAA